MTKQEKQEALRKRVNNYVTRLLAEGHDFDLLLQLLDGAWQRVHDAREDYKPKLR